MHMIARTYRTIRNKFGANAIDLLVPKDKQIIMNRVVDATNLIMDKIIRVDRLNVTINGFDPGWNHHPDGMSFIVYEAIGRNFHIERTHVYMIPGSELTECALTITKK